MSVRRRCGVLCAALLVGLAIVGARPARPPLLDFEYEAAQKEVGRLRMLAERLSKQNVLYQLHLADQHKLQLMETAREVNDALTLLQQGDATVGVPRPPTPALAEQVDGVREAWVPLEQLVMASPYEYLRRSRQFMARRDDRGDPLRILQFDRMASSLLVEVDRLSELYRDACLEDEYPNCPELAASGLPQMLVERLVKESVMLFAGLEEKVGVKQVEATRDAFASQLDSFDDIDAVKRATAPERGATGEHVRAILQDLDESWQRLVREVTLVIRGQAEEANLRRALAVQQIVVDDLQRLRVAVEQAVGAGLQ